MELFSFFFFLAGTAQTAYKYARANYRNAFVKYIHGGDLERFVHRQGFYQLCFKCKFLHKVLLVKCINDLLLKSLFIAMSTDFV